MPDPFLTQRRELAATIAQQADTLANGTHAGPAEAVASLLAENVETLKVWALMARDRS